MKRPEIAIEPGQMRLICVSAGHPLRPAVADLIRSKYFEVYGARLEALANTIIVLTDGCAIHCAAGLRDASESYLSELYLDQPIDRILGSIAGRPVHRDEIVEVSSLVSLRPEISVVFLRSLIAHGERLGFKWAFFTATARLQKLLNKIGISLIELALADAKRVPAPDSWGSYYRTDPKVFAIGRDQVAALLLHTCRFEFAEAC